MQVLGQQLARKGAKGRESLTSWQLIGRYSPIIGEGYLHAKHSVSLQGSILNATHVWPTRLCLPNTLLVPYNFAVPQSCFAAWATHMQGVPDITAIQSEDKHCPVDKFLVGGQELQLISTVRIYTKTKSRPTDKELLHCRSPHTDQETRQIATNYSDRQTRYSGFGSPARGKGLLRCGTVSKIIIRNALGGARPRCQTAGRFLSPNVRTNHRVSDLLNMGVSGGDLSICSRLQLQRTVRFRPGLPRSSGFQTSRSSLACMWFPLRLRSRLLWDFSC